MKRGLSEFELSVDVESEAGEDISHLEEALVPAPPKPGKQEKQDRQNRRKARKTGKGTRLCRACGCTKPESEFSMNQNIDMSCKKALDNIGRIAKQQGPAAVQFLTETKANPAKLKQMLESYGKAHKLWTAGKTSRSSGTS